MSLLIFFFTFFFFFQAEDGIRDVAVTGVQTCALPISDMATRAPFLTTRFGAYYHRDVPQEDTELTHTNPETPCGEYLRRFWQPICFTDELRDVPDRVRVLGEDLVVFRDFRGAIGLLELHCPHRGTSLEFGLIPERGIRCCYHGWLFDVDGVILE